MDIYFATRRILCRIIARAAAHFPEARTGAFRSAHRESGPSGHRSGRSISGGNRSRHGKPACTSTFQDRCTSREMDEPDEPRWMHGLDGHRGNRDPLRAGPRRLAVPPEDKINHSMKAAVPQGWKPRGGPSLEWRGTPSLIEERNVPLRVPSVRVEGMGLGKHWANVRSMMCMLNKINMLCQIFNISATSI